MLSIQMEKSVDSGKLNLPNFNQQIALLMNIFCLQCSAECGSGTRSRQRVCMRLYMKNHTEKPPARKRGQQVNERYCQHMKQPPFIPKTKACRKQLCAAPKWDVTTWSKVSLFSKKSFFFLD